MAQLRRFLLRLSNVFRPDRAESELARELASHLMLLEEDFQRRGMTPDEARVAARRAFAGVEQTKDLQRDARSFLWLDDARRDLRHALRLLRRDPLFTLTAALSLAIGIGANTTVFTVANALLLRPPPVWGNPTVSWTLAAVGTVVASAPPLIPISSIFVSVSPPSRACTRIRGFLRR